MNTNEMLVPFGKSVMNEREILIIFGTKLLAICVMKIVCLRAAFQEKLYEPGDLESQKNSILGVMVVYPIRRD